MRYNAEEYGLVYKDKAPYEILYTKELSYEEVLKLKMIEEMLELYYNSGHFITASDILVLILIRLLIFMKL